MSYNFHISGLSIITFFEYKIAATKYGADFNEKVLGNTNKWICKYIECLI